jgi:hypothetical protein
MAATKRQMNWTGVGFTPSGGSLLAATGVQGVTLDMGGSLAKFSGDGDRYPTTVVNDFNDPTITVTTGDEIWLGTLTVGSRGVFVATHKDAKSAATGSITFTVTTAVIATISLGGQHRQFGSGSVTFNVESADGTTPPVGTALT